ncbi:t-SNARE [Mrakia frigida]|uniref:t-SNARE syntaxin n=1 Tax=Mrakia frigida TaxID=29902 RepID=UPI003FCBEF09
MVASSNPRDRTTEFRQCYSSIANRSSLPKTATTAKGAAAAGKQSKSEIARLAGGIARDINATTGKLQKLAQLAKRKTLFDDRPVEISELTYIIKQDISDLNSQIASLQHLTKASSSNPPSKKAGTSKQVEEHNSNVVMLLQSKLANMGMGFKDVLEIRTQNMKASKDRTEQFMYTTGAPASYAPPPGTQSILSQPPPNRSAYAQGDETSGNAVDKKGKGRGDYLALDMENAESGSTGGTTGREGAGGFMQMQMMEEQDNYITTRSTAIETIESTIAELGTIFSQLASMVAEQRETVQRIDADTVDIQNNVSGAQRELLKYYASVSSNRWLMVKIFGVLIIFFLMFILVT